MRSIFILGLVLLLSSCQPQSKSKPITEFSQKDLESGILLDVRTPEEFAAGHLESAVNINWFDADFKNQVEALDKQKTIYVYCKKGGRSAKAAHVLDSLGYKHVIDLIGGYDALPKK